MGKVRRTEVSSKFFEMGKSLMDEGMEINDPSLLQAGSVMLILATVLINDDDMIIFSEVCSMFSAKKILLEMEGMSENQMVAEILRKKQGIKPVKRRRPKSDDPGNPLV